MLPVIFLLGPTASGKTRLAVELNRQLPIEIISVDSALVYKGMDIGTAKPEPEILKEAPHRLIDFLDPADSYSAAAFAEDARGEIEKIHAAGRIPLLVGGTMLYVNALLHGLSDLPDANESIRAAIDAEAEQKGWPVLHERLRSEDPDTAARIHPNDSQRIQRALEVIELTGKGPSLHASPVQNFPWKSLKLVVNPPDRAVLHERIASRFEMMMTEGFLDEVVRLRDRGDLDLNMPSMRCVGYRQLWRHLDGEWGLDEAKDRAIAASRQLAKRQLTWLRNWPEEMHWLDPDSPKLLESALKIMNDGGVMASAERGA